METNYKKAYIDETVGRLKAHFPSESDVQLRKRAVNIFNKSHRFTKKDGYTKKNTVFASSISNAVAVHVMQDRMEKSNSVPALKSMFDDIDSHSAKFTTNVSLAAVEIGNVEIDANSIPKTMLASDKFKEVFNNRNDLILLDLILVVEGVNANKDEFTKEELKKSYKTLIGMPLTEEHLPTDIQGVFYDAQLVDLDVANPETDEVEKRKAVRTQAIFYKNRFPDEADAIIGRATMGTLRFSMECYFEKAACSECGEEYTSVWDYCDHLWDRFESYSPVSRELKGVKFVGGSYVRYPAEKKAVLLDFKDFSKESLAAAAASERKVVYHIAVDDAHFVWADDNSATDKPDSNIEGEESMDLETLLAKYPELAEKIKAVAEAKAQEIVASMQEASVTEELEATITSLNEQKDALSTELEQLKAAIAERDARDRALAYISTLEKEGVEISSDDERAKLVALFTKSSDEDAELLMSFLRKTKASKPENTDDEGSGNDDKKDDAGNDDESSKASDNENEDDKSKSSGSLPLSGDKDDYKAVASTIYGKHLHDEALDGISALAEMFDTNQGDRS